MPDEIKVTGSVDLVEVVATLHHAVEEMKRLGQFVKEEKRESDRKIEKLTETVGEIRADLRVTDREMKLKIGGISAFVSAIVSGVFALFKMGVL